MAATKKSMLFLAIVVAVGGLGLVYVKYLDHKAVPDSTTETASSDSMDDGSIPLFENPSQAGLTKLGGYLCRDESAACRDDPYAAKDDAEAEWLLQHGYPTSLQIANLRSHSSGYYKREFEQTGSQVAQSLYGMSLAEEGQGRSAVGILGNAARQGNVYALYALSSIYGAQGELGNLITSAAYQRLAIVAGDGKAGDEYARKFQHLTPPEHAAADREAAKLHQSLLTGASYPRPL